MNSDPIVSLFVIVFRRVMSFIILSVLLSLILWCWLLKSHFGIPSNKLIVWLQAAWSPSESKLPELFFYGSLAIGTLCTSVIYLLIGSWWKKRATVPGPRGGHIEDARAR